MPESEFLVSADRGPAIRNNLDPLRSSAKQTPAMDRAGTITGAVEAAALAPLRRGARNAYLAMRLG